MILGGLLHRAGAKLRAVAKRVRSPKWAAVERRYLAHSPDCAACGSTKHMQVHHVFPYHLDPSLELDVTNLLGLCVGPNRCHLRIGHGGSWQMRNPYSRRDAQECRAFPERHEAVDARARLARVR